MSATPESVQLFIGRTCLALDDEDFDQFLASCASDFSYRVSTFSPELGKEMVWLEHGREGYESMVRMLPKHVRMDGRFSRNAIVCDVKYSESDRATVISRLTVVHTNACGESRMLLTGRYLDTLDLSGSSPVLAAREVRLETRDLGPLIHAPI